MGFDFLAVQMVMEPMGNEPPSHPDRETPLTEQARLWREITRRPRVAESTQGGRVIPVADNSAVRSRG
jgi:hypothetical protein